MNSNFENVRGQWLRHEAVIDGLIMRWDELFTTCPIKAGEIKSSQLLNAVCWILHCLSSSASLPRLSTDRIRDIKAGMQQELLFRGVARKEATEITTYGTTWEWKGEGGSQMPNTDLTGLRYWAERLPSFQTAGKFSDLDLTNMLSGDPNKIPSDALKIVEQRVASNLRIVQSLSIIIADLEQVRSAATTQT